MKTGVNTGTILRPKTSKQKRDAKIRKKRANARAHAQLSKVNKAIGNLHYKCSNCGNKVRMNEDIGERKILCTKCNAGVFVR